MNCFPCFGSKKEDGNTENIPVAQAKDVPSTNLPPKKHGESTAKDVDTENIAGKSFTFRELASATKNFRKECLLSEGGSGRVFKGTLQSGEIVAVKQLDKNSTQGNKDFLVELTMLSHLHHENLLNLIGYCADGDQRLLVYEYLSFGTVEDHLLDVKEDKKPLDWSTRIKIANGTAQGLEYLHEKANPPVIYRDLKSSNIMLDAESNPKLADYGLAKLGGTNSHVTPRVMGNYGYCAPEYERSAELTVKSDVYSFGVILLELLTGRRALDTNRPIDEQNLVAWAQPYFKDPKRFPEMADPLLGNAYPVKSLNQAVGVAAMCLQDEPEVRPYISDIVAALSFLVMAPPEPQPQPQPQPQPEPQSQPAPPVVDTPTPNVSDDNKPQEKENNEEDNEEEEEDDEGSSQYESGDSYESSEYESEEEEEDQKVDGDEVASMSGTSNDDGSGSGKSSMSLKRKSTKKPKEENEEWHESNGTSSARISSRKSSMRSKSKSKSKKIGSELENGSASKRRKSKHAKNRSYSTYQRDPSSGNGNVEPGNRRAKSVHYGNKQEKL